MHRSVTSGTMLIQLVLIVHFLTPIGAAQSGDADPDTAARFIGTWRLVAIADPTNPNRGANPTGLIYYDDTGHMAMQIKPDRPRPKWAGLDPTPEEAKTTLLGYGAYFGTYTIDARARTVTHHLEGALNPRDDGIDVVRRYEFTLSDRLILTPVETPANYLTWERIK